MADPELWEWTLVTSSQYQLPGPGGNETSTESKSPSEWLLLLFWRQRWVLVASLVLAIGGAFVYLRTATPLFTSTSTLTVRPATTIVLTNSQGGHQANALTFTNAQMEVIRSEAVLSLASTLIAERDKTAPKITVKELRQILDLGLDRNTDIISVTSRSPSPQAAATMTEAVVDAYMKFATSRKEFTSAPEMLERYQAELTAADTELKKKENELRELEAKHGPAIRQDEKNSLEQRRLDSLNQQLIATELELKNAERDADVARAARKSMAGTKPATAVDPFEAEMELGVASVQEQTALRLEMIQVKAQLEELREKYGDGHPARNTLEKRLNRLNRIYLSSIERREDTLRRQVAMLREQYKQAKDEILSLNSFTDSYRVAKGELEKLRTIREKYDDKIREIRLEQDTGGLLIEVIDPAAVPTKPTLPAAPKVMVIAVAMGLILGMVLAALREWLDDRMRSATEIRSSLGLPLLAVIPQSTTKRSFSVSGQRVLLDPGSDAAEAYRSLRTAIQFSAPAGLKTLTISSPNSGDGKTTLVTNLGIAWAQSGKKVCIVDCDLRKPTVHDIFSLKTTLGLSTLLAGRSSLDGTLQHTSVGGLDVLPCGPVPANPAEILNSQEFGTLLETLADRYDIVLLDTPPVMSATDARVIAASTDATLIVLTAQSAHRRSTENTRDALESVGARIIGLVVNDVPGRSGGNYGSSKSSRTLVGGLTNQEQDAMTVRSR